MSFEPPVVASSSDAPVDVLGGPGVPDGRGRFPTWVKVVLALVLGLVLVVVAAYVALAAFLGGAAKAFSEDRGALGTQASLIADVTLVAGSVQGLAENGVAVEATTLPGGEQTLLGGEIPVTPQPGNTVSIRPGTEGGFCVKAWKTLVPDVAPMFYDTEDADPLAGEPGGACAN